MEQVMGIEPTYPAWKAGVLADVLHLHRESPQGERRLPHGDRNLKKGEKVSLLLSINIIPKNFIEINYFRINHLIYSL